MLTALVTGNLGKDAETREAGQDTVTSFSVASNRKVKGEDVVTWVRCSVWGKRGEALRKHLGKGTKVACSGELSTREYEGKTYLELRVNELDFLSSGSKREDSDSAKHDRAKSNGYQPQGDAHEGGSPSDDDLPFAPVDRRLP